MSIAVIVATYPRADGTTPQKLEKMYACLRAQTRKDFTLFLMGDGYNNSEEWERVCALYDGEKYVENCPNDFRSVFRARHNLWSCGGMAARYRGIQRAKELGFEFYLHLDDDDVWAPRHVHNLMHMFDTKPSVDVVSCCATYLNIVLPREWKVIRPRLVDNWKPLPENSVHSSWGIRLSTMYPLLQHEYESRLQIIESLRAHPEQQEPKFIPFDAHLLKVFRDAQRARKIHCMISMENTCSHREEKRILAAS